MNYPLETHDKINMQWTMAFKTTEGEEVQRVDHEGVEVEFSEVGFHGEGKEGKEKNYNGT